MKETQIHKKNDIDVLAINILYVCFRSGLEEKKKPKHERITIILGRASSRPHKISTD
jgi:hypothetical protein